MDMTTAVDNCTHAELNFIRALYYPNNWSTAQGFWEYLIQRQVVLTRDELCAQYNIGRDDFGKYSSISEEDAYKLMMAGLKDAAEAILEQATSPYGISDDGLDYLAAASDQIDWVTEVLRDDAILSNKGRPAAVLSILNMTQADFDADPSLEYGFKYGYADHGSPISDLAHINDEEDD